MKYVTLLLFSFVVLSAQPATAQSAKPLKKVLELKIPREGGANGASVAWHPVQKKYYAAMAGNTTYFIGAYSITGKLMSPEELEAQFDIRGLWYNPKAKNLQMNGYNDFGWAEYKLDSKGIPKTVSTLLEDMNQPAEQSVGTFNSKDNVVYFFNEEGHLDVYDMSGEFQKNIELTLGKTKKEAEAEEESDNAVENYNSSTAVYTGVAGAEIGLLNHAESTIELYNLKDGHMVRKLSLPKDAPVNEFLNFSYTNGTWWLFDKDLRIWKGYK